MSVVTLFEGTEKLGTEKLQRGAEEEVDVSVLVGGKQPVVGLYFSAHWCPPCRSVA